MNPSDLGANPESPAVDAAGFFDGWWRALEGRGWEALVLHSWQELPERIGSDIDYAVRGPGARDLLRFLAEYSRGKGWRLVQSIEHEPGAFFCVCQQAAPPFEALQLDVTWSYRRLGHRLVPAEVIFEGRRPATGKSFQVPSAGSEFVYLLAKAAAKGKDFGKVRGRLAELLEEDAEGCRAMARRCFGDGPAAGVDSIEDWAEWFAGAPAFAAVRGGRRLGAEETGLYLRRMREPTGFLLRVRMDPGDPELERVAELLRPSFRGTMVEGRGAGERLRRWVRRVRTRLVIEATGATGESVEEAVGRGIGLLAERMERRIERMRGR